MIRTLLIILEIVFIAIFTIFDFVYCLILKMINKEKVVKHNFVVVRIFLSVMQFLSGVRIHINGEENLELAKAEKAVLIISNHRGFFDIISGYNIFNFPVSIVAKDSLRNFFVVSYWMKKIGCFFLDRKDLRSGVQMVVDSISKISKGVSVWIFPEGTRGKSDNPIELLEFKEGAFKIAEKTNCKILPVAFFNTENAFEKHIPFVKATDIYINVGKVFSISELDKDKQDSPGQATREKIIDLIKESKWQK